MDGLLVEVQALLVAFPSEQAELRKALNLAEALETAAAEHADSSPASQSAACASLETLAKLLSPPRAFCVDEEDLDANARLAKDAFRRQVPVLSRLAIPLVHTLPPVPDPPTREDLELLARLLLAAGRFAHADLSAGLSNLDVAEHCSVLVDRLFHHPPHGRLPLLRHLLTFSLPAFFKPHPKLNPATGRVLSRPLGGDRGVTDWFEQGDDDATSWRKQPGLGGVVKVVVEALQPGEVEDLWPFLLPPLLAFLDDYEAANKLLGIAILDALLDKVDESLLRRTGVGKVFEKSLENAFSSLSDPLSPALLAAAHPTALKLLNVQHPPSPAPASDEPRFSALCALLSASVIHTWEFKGGNVPLEHVAAQALPPLLDALGAGTVRYLQVLVPHLCGLLESSSAVWTAETAAMLGAAAGALRSVVRNGRARIARWEGQGNVAMQELEEALKEVVRELEAAVGSKALSMARSVPDPVLDGLFPAAPPVAAQ
ncbi:hypothetical protein JCM10450v2_003952 [Rhodotorula kratochvilovae]